MEKNRKNWKKIEEEKMNKFMEYLQGMSEYVDL